MSGITKQEFNVMDQVGQSLLASALKEEAELDALEKELEDEGWVTFDEHGNPVKMDTAPPVLDGDPAVPPEEKAPPRKKPAAVAKTHTPNDHASAPKP